MQRLNWQRIVKGIDIVALTIAAYLCAGIWWQLVGAHFIALQPGQAGGGAPQDTPGENRPQPDRDLGVIIKRNLFQAHATPTPGSEQAQIDSLAATTLNLQLLGTVAVVGIEGRIEPRAVILDKTTGQQDVYREGDTVAQATIRKILRAKVVLGVQGRDEILAMDLNPAGGGGQGGGAGRGGGTGNRVVLNRQEVQSAMGNMTSLLSQVKIKPVSGDNGASGFALDRIASGSLFDKIGLVNGDVIQGANGKTVTSPEEAFALYQGLKNQSNVSLTIIRDGKPETVNVVLQ
jgi:general secretion pathway protein C